MLLWRGERFGLWIVEMGSSVISLALDGSFHCVSAERLAGISVVTLLGWGCLQQCICWVGCCLSGKSGFLWQADPA